ncbi:MAG: hypothetical protein U0V72_00745 [Cytophagales bacterium]
MATGKIIGKVVRPKNSLVFVDGDGNVRAKTLKQFSGGKQHGSNTMDGVKSRKKTTKAKSTREKSKPKAKSKR